MELTQQRAFKKQKYKIHDKGVEAVISTWKEKTEWDISFEELGTKIIRKTDKSGLVAFIIFGVFFLITLYVVIEEALKPNGATKAITFGLFSFFWIFLMYLSYHSINKELVYLTGGTQILEFQANYPDRETVNNFVNQLTERIKSYLKIKYGRIDLDLPEETQLQNFYWLRNSDIITEHEYDELKKELKTKKLL